MTSASLDQTELQQRILLETNEFVAVDKPWGIPSTGRRLNDPDGARASYRSYLDQAPGGPLAGQVREALCRLGDTTMCPGER